MKLHLNSFHFLFKFCNIYLALIDRIQIKIQNQIEIVNKFACNFRFIHENQPVCFEHIEAL